MRTCLSGLRSPHRANDMSVYEKSLATVLICSAVFCLLSIPLIFRKVPRNSLYGYRTRTTLSDDRIWYETNAYFGLRFIIGSIVSACLAIIVYECRCISPDMYPLVTVVLLAAPVAIAGLLTTRFVRSISTEKRPSNNVG